MPLVVSGDGEAEISAKIILSNIRIQVGKVLQSEQENWVIEDDINSNHQVYFYIFDFNKPLQSV